MAGMVRARKGKGGKGKNSQRKLSHIKHLLIGLLVKILEKNC
jgi:hypothetical protein